MLNDEPAVVGTIEEWLGACAAQLSLNPEGLAERNVRFYLTMIKSIQSGFSPSCSNALVPGLGWRSLSMPRD